jgi:hypothetical protein
VVAVKAKVRARAVMTFIRRVKAIDKAADYVLILQTLAADRVTIRIWEYVPLKVRLVT